MKKVQVLLSSYNGEKYIKCQLDSIINQTYKNLDILVRDDGSTDNTIDILKDYKKKYSNFNFIKGQNIGVINSFFELMRISDKDCEYFAFSDQDDYFLENKIEVAVDKITEFEKHEHIPLLYCSNPKVVYENLQEVSKNYAREKIPSFGNAMIENINTGCTCVFNRKLLELVIKQLPENGVIMHDWWLYLTATAFGKVIYDPNSYVLYRQHTNNQVGQSIKKIDKWKKRFKSFASLKNKYRNQLKEFYYIFKQNIENDKKQMIITFIESQNKLEYRIKVSRSKEIFRQNSLDNKIFKILFLLNFI